MKKRKDVTPKDVLRWLAQGDGQGAGKVYRPSTMSGTYRPGHGAGIEDAESPSLPFRSRVVGVDSNRYAYLSGVRRTSCCFFYPSDDSGNRIPVILELLKSTELIEETLVVNGNSPFRMRSIVVLRIFLDGSLPSAV